MRVHCNLCSLFLRLPLAVGACYFHHSRGRNSAIYCIYSIRIVTLHKEFLSRESWDLFNMLDSRENIGSFMENSLKFVRDMAEP